jgi:glutamate synthase (NADPH) large chain
VHNLLVREETRTQVALITESGEPREVMHFALLSGYGASAINPYLALETVENLAWRGELADGITPELAVKNFMKSVKKGLLKTFAKMGISTLQSYQGAQVFEAIGLNKKLVETYFAGTTSRLEGSGARRSRSRIAASITSIRCARSRSLRPSLPWEATTISGRMGNITC